MLSGLLGGLFGLGKPSRPEKIEEPPSNPISSLLSGGDPMGSLAGMLGGIGLEGQESMSSSGAPSYKPPSGSTRDVAVLITGCQAHETSVST